MKNKEKIQEIYNNNYRLIKMFDTITNTKQNKMMEQYCQVGNEKSATDLVNAMTYVAEKVFHNVEVGTLQQIATYYDQRFLTFLSFLKFRYESDMNMKDIDQLKKISIEKVILEKQKTHILMPQELEMVK